jgi:hypothetical protein
LHHAWLRRGETFAIYADFLAKKHRRFVANYRNLSAKSPLVSRELAR